ncbi:MAG: hypothetical protein AAF488_11385, partial [Planctomycetota bacterium]
FDDPTERDIGRLDVTGNFDHAYAFKSPTLRQVRDAGPYFHGGDFNTLKEVVEYFNNGIPNNELAASAGNLDPLFIDPHGDGTPGLGLSEADVDALVDFLANGLYDRAFVHFDPDSPTDTFELNMRDLDYEPELRNFGAVDGWLPSGLPNGVNDPMSRDQILFVRGAVNPDSHVDIADTIFLLSYLFNGGPAPAPMVKGDVNDDRRVDVADPIYLIGFLFLGGSAPPYPYPEVGQDLTP